jgi:hypothetical protein
MAPQKILGPCVVCLKNQDNINYRRVTVLAFEKAVSSSVYQEKCPNLALGDVLCHNCYCSMVEHNVYVKYS